MRRLLILLLGSLCLGGPLAQPSAAGAGSAASSSAEALQGAAGSKPLLDPRYRGSFLHLGDVLHRPSGMPDPSKPYVRMAVNPFALPNQNVAIVLKTVELLARTFGENNFEARVMRETRSASKADVADLVLGSAGTYRKSVRVGARDLATLISDYFPDPNLGEGALFVSLKSSGIRAFGDMKGKTAVFLDPNAFSGYEAALGEVAERGENPDSFFGASIFADASMPREIDLLRSGAADVAAVRTCFLEELRERGEDISDLQPVALRFDKPADFQCLASTRLYPNWTLFSTPSASPEVARKSVVALFSMPELANGVHWGVASDFTPVDGLYRSIRRGPYEYLRTWTWAHFWESYRAEILFAAAFVILVVLYGFAVSWLVGKRTRELERALGAKRLADEERARAQLRLERLQKSAVTSQMSYVIAHELRQPLSAILSFTHGVKKLADREDCPGRPLILHGLERIGEQAELAEEIVQRVRDHVKERGGARAEVDLNEVVRRAASTLESAGSFAGRLSLRLSEAPLPVLGDPLELELIAINLVKNAMEAAQAGAEGAKGGPSVAVTLRADYAGELPRAVLEVEDSGEPLTDEAFRKLEGGAGSRKEDGLGVGLEIVRMFLSGYGGHLSFERLPERGLRARATLLLHDAPRAAGEEP